MCFCLFIFLFVCLDYFFVEFSGEVGSGFSGVVGEVIELFGIFLKKWSGLSYEG